MGDTSEFIFLKINDKYISDIYKQYFK